MKFAGTNMDMKLWAEVAVLAFGLEEYGIDLDQYMDEEFNNKCEEIVDSVPKNEQEHLEEVLKNHVLSIFIEKYSQLKQQYYGGELN